MALANLPGRKTGLCVQCQKGPTAYAEGGFPVGISCVADLRGPEDILAIYTWISAGARATTCSVHPELSGILMAKVCAVGKAYTNTVQLLAYGSISCNASGLMQEVGDGADLSHINFCVTVRGR